MQHLIIAGTIALEIICIVMGITIGDQLRYIPHITTSSPISQGIIPAISPRITVIFNTPIDFRSLNIHAFPANDLTIEKKGYFNNRLPFGRKITIIPNTTIPPGERVMVYFSNMKGVLTREFGGEQLLELQTEDPTIIDSNPADNSSSVSTTQSFVLHLSSPIGFESEWSATTIPAHPLIIEKVDPTTLRITPRQPFQQGAKYEMTITQTPIVLHNTDGTVFQRRDPNTKSTIRFTTVRPAFVKSFDPQGSSVNPNGPIAIQFDQPMDRQSVEKGLQISPTISLSINWEASNSGLQITHIPFQKDTNYTVTFNKGIMTANGGMLETDASFPFHTVGPLLVTTTQPAPDNTTVSINASIKMFFDQDISPSQNAKFSLEPTTTGAITIKNNILEFIPHKPLAFETRYTAKLQSGTESIYGLPSAKEQTFSFTTSPNEILLPVPFFLQQEAFTCNIAAARMLLAFRGITIDEATLKNKMGNGGKRGSGNPFKGYIDDYGTYWDVMAHEVATYRPTRLISGTNINDIITEIQKGNPVMIWGQNGWSDSHDISWTTKDGTQIKAVNGMHSSVVRGFRGAAENPTHIVLNDPWRGQYAIETKEFLRRWKFLSMAMVVD